MKRYLIFILFITLILSAEGFTQQHGMRNRKGNHRDKIDQLEKVKLMEELNMSEEVSIKFFARRNEFRERERRLIDQMDSLSTVIGEKSSNPDVQTTNAEWEKIIEEYNAVESMMRKNKSDFVSSLQNILTPKQRAEFLAFERKFRREIQEIIMRGRQKPIPE